MKQINVYEIGIIDKERKEKGSSWVTIFSHHL